MSIDLRRTPGLTAGWTRDEAPTSPDDEDASATTTAPESAPESAPMRDPASDPTTDADGPGASFQ